MAQVRRSDSTKNLLAILTVIVGVVVGYLVIEEATRSESSTRLGLNEVTGPVSGTIAIAPAERERGMSQTVGSSPAASVKPTNVPATSEPSVQVATAEKVSAATVSSLAADQAPTVIEPGDAEASAVAGANEQIEQAPPAAVLATGEGNAAVSDVQETPDRLVLSAEDTTIIARRYVDEPPVSSPENNGLKLATRFASATRIVPFAFNRVGMGPEGEAAVQELVPIAMKAEKVHVRGRTDSKGAFEINKQVALERAYTVREKFVEAGVPADKLGISYCTECFIATNETEAGRRANRRVDVEFIMPSDQVDALPETTFAKPLPESARKLSFARSLGSMDRDETQ